MTVKWKETTVNTNRGAQNAVAPWIISASRATDIPAYYSKWFFDRLEKGYVKWINPFNRLKPQYISFKNTKVIVFWSKNPVPVIPFLERLKDRKISCYFQFTVNYYEDENFEPNLPSLEQRIETFKYLSETLGKECVIWRFDPLLLSDRTEPDRLLEKIQRVGDHLHPFTEKLVFSFADIVNYSKVQKNLKNKGINYREFYDADMRYMAEGISNLNRSRSWGLKIATCGEEARFKEFGIEHNKCIDDDLIVRITEKQGREPEFNKFLGLKPSGLSLFQEELSKIDGSSKTDDKQNSKLKDKGQRKACGCIYSKDIGSYDTCLHGCVYCYANSSPEAAQRNQEKINVDSEALLS
ncbi:MAG: DUF1848 domain-containing protein [Desulfamplus sp.]|nr:DUF1848 domain-containing protein [Desulfamplus sp.]